MASHKTSEHVCQLKVLERMASPGALSVISRLAERNDNNDKIKKGASIEERDPATGFCYVLCGCLSLLPTSKLLLLNHV
jgi:hypothetical protein